jgi:TetR/AcrR family transcriptional regulator, transcriptional repressor for nem operon
VKVNATAGADDQNGMAGVKQFERGVVLDRAMALFWQQGYEATSIQDLVDATGINRGSIYGTFGDKQGLFLAVLDRYAEKIAQPLISQLSDPDPRRALECMLDSIIRRTSDPKLPRGCLNTNTALECPATDQITRKIVAGFGQQESAIYNVLRKAQTAGHLAADFDLRALSRFFVAVCHGMNVINKAMPDPEILRDIARVAMTLWQPTATPRRRSASVRHRPRRAPT